MFPQPCTAQESERNFFNVRLKLFANRQPVNSFISGSFKKIERHRQCMKDSEERCLKQLTNVTRTALHHRPAVIRGTMRAHTFRARKLRIELRGKTNQPRVFFFITLTSILIFNQYNIFPLQKPVNDEIEYTFCNSCRPPGCR